MPVVTVVVNGGTHEIDAGPQLKLLDVLRHDLGLTGTKYGCGEGQCGACTVLVDGMVVRACTTRVARARRAAGFAPIESLERDGLLHPVQKAFLEQDAMQCGYCTAGMIMAAVGLLEKNASPDEAAIVKGMDHNVCRCGTSAGACWCCRWPAARSRRSPAAAAPRASPCRTRSTRGCTSPTTAP